MRRAVTTLSTIALVSLAPSALAANEATSTVPASGGLEGLTVTVDAAGRTVRFVTVRDHGELPVALDAAEIDAAKIEVVPVIIGPGKQVLHVQIPSRTRPGVAWEALVAGQAGAVLWSGVTGFATGEEGERAGEAVDLPGDAGGFIVVGEVREDLRICGQPRTLLTPRVLDPRSMAFRGATMQRLSEEKRDDAEPVAASGRSAPVEAPLARLLLATGASTAIGAPSALTDGDPATAWSEGRPGDGHGEFVTMRAPAEIPITRLAIVPAPTVLPAHGAAPRTFYLVTDARTIAVTLPEDAWAHPGAAYDIPLAEPLRASCVSLVLDKSYARAGEPHPEVTIAELTAYSELDHPGATLADAAHALGGGGARAEAARAILERAGDAGLLAASAAYASLDAPGRALAIDAAIGAGTCEASAPLLLAAMGDRDTEVARKGSEKLERCGKRAAPALLKALRDPDSASRANAARLIATIAPSDAVDPLAAALARGDTATRGAVRAALAKASRAATTEKLTSLVADGGRAPEARVELLRALEERLPGVAGTADAAIASLAPAASFQTRYRLVGPLAALARSGDSAATARLGAWISGDSDAAVRAHAAESSGGISALRDTLVHAIDDASPRVRKAALDALANAKISPPIEPMARRLASDEWTFVRSAAAGALASSPADPHVDDALLTALDDRAPTVRTEVVTALAARGVKRAGKTLRARLGAGEETLETRIAVARALATLCDRESIDALTAVAQQSVLPLATDEDMMLGFEATNSLGALHPPDLAKRLAPLAAKDASAEARASATRALATAPTCR